MRNPDEGMSDRGGSAAVPWDAELPASAQPTFDEMYPTLAALRPHAPRLVADYEHALELARCFRREFIDRHALSIDRRIMADPTYVAEDAIREGARHGLFGMMVPKVLGGMGMPFGAMAVAMEELGAGCLGISNLLGVHGLALSTIAATGDLAKMEEVARRLVETERQGRPALLSTAITEPGAGTDVEDAELLRTARLGCEARPVRGGYRLEGRKVFISNGSIAQTHVVIAPTDRSRPVETTFAFLVETGTKGSSVGRVERKMGQKACPAAELVFDRCFVPEDRRLRSQPLHARGVELVLGATRGGVGAWGAAAARGAYERALAYARTHKVGGRWLVDQQWAQMRLADMHRNVMLARAAYVEALVSNQLFGLASLTGTRAQEVARHLPRGVLESSAARRLVTSRAVRRGARRAVDGLERRKVDVSCAYGAAAKVSATDLGMANCHLALDLMGTCGLRHDRGMEKLYRDAKLLQIYEGTNQLNRLELFKKAVDDRPEPPRLGHPARRVPVAAE
ncbi:MAG: acyl-CoA dehydrogenase family protein [Myxococcota bacterium]